MRTTDSVREESRLVNQIIVYVILLDVEMPHYLLNMRISHEYTFEANIYVRF